MLRSCVCMYKTFQLYHRCASKVMLSFSFSLYWTTQLSVKLNAWHKHIRKRLLIPQWYTRCNILCNCNYGHEWASSTQWYMIGCYIIACLLFARGYPKSLTSVSPICDQMWYLLINHLYSLLVLCGLSTQLHKLQIAYSLWPRVMLSIHPPLQ